MNSGSTSCNSLLPSPWSDCMKPGCCSAARPSDRGWNTNHALSAYSPSGLRHGSHYTTLGNQMSSSDPRLVWGLPLKLYSRETWQDEATSLSLKNWILKISLHHTPFWFLPHLSSYLGLTPHHSCPLSEPHKPPYSHLLPYLLLHGVSTKIMLKEELAVRGEGRRAMMHFFLSVTW